MHSSVKYVLAAILALSVPSMAAALPESQQHSDPHDHSDDAPNVEGDLDIFAKLAAAFDGGNTAPIDPDSLALASITTQAILPDGTYARIMDNTLSQLLQPLFAIADQTSAADIAAATGLEAADVEDLDEEQLNAVGKILDPQRAGRSQKMLDFLIPVMKEAFTDIEPALREGMARAYARKFSASQLSEMNAFFKTPTGAFYASESFVIMADPEIMQASMQVMPLMMEKLFAKIPDMEQEFANSHKPRTLADLSDKEIENLADMLSVNPEHLVRHRDAQKDSEHDADEGDHSGHNHG